MNIKIGSCVRFIQRSINFQGWVINIDNGLLIVAVPGQSELFSVPPDSVAPGISAAPLLWEHDLARTFTEWERRYREEPEQFYSEAQKLLKETPETYGESCAPYFIQIVRELGDPESINGIQAPKEHNACSLATGCYSQNDRHED